MKIAMRMKMLAKMMSPGDQERKLCPSIRVPVSLWQTLIPLASLDLFDLVQFVNFTILILNSYFGVNQ